MYKFGFSANNLVRALNEIIPSRSMFEKSTPVLPRPVASREFRSCPISISIVHSLVSLCR